jgi:hypothetical protein
MRGREPVAAVITAALAVAGCGGSTPAHVTVRTVTRTVTQPAPATTPAASTTTAASTPTTTAAMPACTASDLAISYGGSNGATGNIVLSFALRNTGATPCHTYGFPGVQFLDRTGRPLPTASSRTTHDILGPAPATRLVLAPGHTASFRLVAPLSKPGASCANAYGLQAIAPDDTAHLIARIPDGLTECGTVTVSPLQPGT